MSPEDLQAQAQQAQAAAQAPKEERILVVSAAQRKRCATAPGVAGQWRDHGRRLPRGRGDVFDVDLSSMLRTLGPLTATEIVWTRTAVGEGKSCVALSMSCWRQRGGFGCCFILMRLARPRLTTQSSLIPQCSDVDPELEALQRIPIFNPILGHSSYFQMPLLQRINAHPLAICSQHLEV